jgi:hypothetical protein
MIRKLAASFRAMMNLKLTGESPSQTETGTDRVASVSCIDDSASNNANSMKS